MARPICRFHSRLGNCSCHTAIKRRRQKKYEKPRACDRDGWIQMERCQWFQPRVMPNVKKPTFTIETLDQWKGYDDIKSNQ